MTQAELYKAVKPDLSALAGPLFVQSEKLLRERGDFLPHAAVLNSEAKVSLMGAMSGSPGAFANSWHILPMLYEGLRALARERSLTAVGIAERVDAIPGSGAVRAVKVLLEHREGLTIAFFMPFRREDSGDYTFGKMQTLFTESEVNAWNQG
jgi:hypothetical protein